MATSEMPHRMVDLECGHRRSTADGCSATSETADVIGNGGSACFSDDEDSCNEFYSTADGDGSASYEDGRFAGGSEILADEGLDSRRCSSSSDEAVDLEIGEKKLHLEKHDGDDGERDCRICHLSLVSSSPGREIAIELGCSCKDDLAAAHKHCAETWFKIKGNKTCEICNSIARNVVGPSDIEANLQFQDMHSEIADNNNNNTSSASTSSITETRSCLNGHRFLNFLLACMVFAFVISWLFHFNIPS